MTVVTPIVQKILANYEGEAPGVKAQPRAGC